MSLDGRFFEQVADDSRDGIAVADMTQPEFPLIYVNPAFERMTGYSSAEVLGRNCRFLQGDMIDQPGLMVLRESLNRGEPCLVTLQNVRKDGRLFWNELSMSPIRDGDGRVTHYVAMQRDVSQQKLMEFALRDDHVALQYELHRLSIDLRTDPLTGLDNRKGMDDALGEMIQLAFRADENLAMYMIELDRFREMTEVCGHLAGDEALRRTGACLMQSRRRVGDLGARFDGEKFILVTSDITPEMAADHADRIVKRVWDLGIHHPLSQSGRLTASLGWVVVPAAEAMTQMQLVDSADLALQAAKRGGGNRAQQGDLAASPMIDPPRETAA